MKTTFKSKPTIKVEWIIVPDEAFNNKSVSSFIENTTILLPADFKYRNKDQRGYFVTYKQAMSVGESMLKNSTDFKWMKIFKKNADEYSLLTNKKLRSQVQQYRASSENAKTKRKIKNIKNVKRLSFSKEHELL